MAELQSALDAAAGGGTVTLGSGRTYILDRQVNVPSDVTLDLNGAILYHSGPVDSDSGHTYAALVFADGTNTVTIENGSIIGNHASGVGRTNHQSKTIQINGTTCADLTFQNLTFENIVGLPIQQSEVNGSDNVQVIDCEGYNCGNDININGSNGVYTGNTFGTPAVPMEGPECAGSGNLFDSNIIHADTVGISIGGDSGGSSLLNNTLTNNTIYVYKGWGIVIADGINGLTVDNNTIITYPGAAGGVTQAWFDEAHDFKNITLDSGNVITLGAGTGINIFNLSGMSNFVVDGVTINGQGTFGIRAFSPNCSVINNVVNGSGSSADIRLEATAAGMTFSGNSYDTLTDLR